MRAGDLISRPFRSLDRPDSMMMLTGPRRDMAAGPARQPQDLMQLLTRAERLLARRLAVVLNSHGCSLDAWRVISLLADGHGHYMTDIAEHAVLPPGTLTKLVDHLVDDNLVYRKVDPADRRRIRAHLTTRGQRLHWQISTGLNADLSGLPMSAAAQESLRALLAETVDALSTSTGVRHSVAPG